tara:strand:+ start:2293 stop:4017 length:1725 start_codon:yes stop_codon:yes gene_type:complete
MKQKILAVIQARGGSKGIPKKNIYPINGHPLISYTIIAALKSKLIDELVVSTDSEEIARVAKQYGANVPFMRPKKLSGDKVFSVDSLMHALEESEKFYQKKYDYVIELPCVAPLRDHIDIDESIKLIIKNKSDSVISMTTTGEKHPIRLKKIVNNKIKDFCKEYPEPGQNSRRQDLEPKSYIRNGAIYLMKRDVLVNTKSRHGNISIPYIMDDDKSVNIDTYEDLRLATYKIRNNECKNYPNEIKKIPVKFFRNNKTKLLITTNLNFDDSSLKKLKKNFSCIYAPGINKEKTIELIKGVDAWLCSPSPKYQINKDIFKYADKLKIIVTPSTGSNHIDKNFCYVKNIKVIALKDSNFVKKIYASSEYTFGLMMATIRNIPQANKSAISGKWREVEDSFRSIELNGKSLGIIGFGRIGSNVAKYASSMGIKIGAYDPYKKINKSNIKQHRNIKTLLVSSDIVLLAVHLDQSTKNMFSRDWFKLMKKGSYFINISRGDIVDEEALISALKSKKITAAGLDVIKNEQSSDIGKSKLIQYAMNNTNLIITPHIAGLTIDSETKAASYSLDQLNKFFNIK